MANSHPNLRLLAERAGVQLAYLDVGKRRRVASPETLAALLSALGIPASSPAEVQDSWQRLQEKTWQTLCEPVAVCWNGRGTAGDIRLPAGLAAEPVALRLELEGESSRSLNCHVGELALVETSTCGSLAYERRQLPSLGKLPLGYHRLHIAVAGREATCLLLAAPRKTYSPESPVPRCWGVLAPVYALQSANDWGAGRYSELEAAGDLVRELGGNLLATLPLLATWLDAPFDPSPYAPVSRLFWNEFYVDATRTPEFARCAAAREQVQSAAFQQAVAARRAEPLVDYRGAAAWQRQVMELLAAQCVREGGPRFEALVAQAGEQPHLADYARFRATADRLRSPWREWPARQRSGSLEPQDYDESAYHYHLYAQVMAQEQLGNVARKMRESGGRLYLDLPLGVNRDGFDAWRFRDLFANEASGGAPPDTFFTGGQNWGFAPLHAERLRETGYRYLVECLRAHLQQAGMLRIDHVMGLHRLFWVPQGLPTAQGGYVRYRAEEWYAVLALESHRARAVIVGENLGTVPAEVNTALHRHGVCTTYVVQYEANPRREPPLALPVAKSVATLNTHDMPPFASFWQTSDLDDLRSLGLFDEAGVAVERDKRRVICQRLAEMLASQGLLPAADISAATVSAALVRWLAASPAEYVLLNLEDLWQEVLPQNTPGTYDERPNWRRKLRHSLEAIQATPAWRQLLAEVARLRPLLGPDRVS